MLDSPFQSRSQQGVWIVGAKDGTGTGAEPAVLRRLVCPLSRTVAVRSVHFDGSTAAGSCESGEVMAQAPRDLTPSESALHLFGSELRRWRELRKMSQRQLGEAVLSSGALIGKIEKADRKPNLDLAARLDEVLDTGQAFRELWSLALQEAPVCGVTDLPQADLGLEWAPTPAATVETVGRLWRADVERRSAVVAAAWVTSAFAVSTRAWLANAPDHNVSHAGGRRVGQADIDGLWSMCHAFAAADHRLGGGYARSTMVHYVNDVVVPLLKGSYNDQVGRKLMAAAARVCDLCGFMAFDSGWQGLAQRQYIQALRLAKASGDKALAAHVLSDMSMQALYLGAAEAGELAEAGAQAARACGSYLSLARCKALSARAYAMQREAAKCWSQLNEAEYALENARSGDEPAWIRFFKPEQLCAESAYAAAGLGDARMVRRFAAGAMADKEGMQRRRVLAGAALASSYLGAGRTGTARDVEQACAVLRDVLPAASTVNSLRSVEALNQARRSLARHSSEPAVIEIERAFDALGSAT